MMTRDVVIELLLEQLKLALNVGQCVAASCESIDRCVNMSTIQNSRILSKILVQHGNALAELLSVTYQTFEEALPKLETYPKESVDIHPNQC